MHIQSHTYTKLASMYLKLTVILRKKIKWNLSSSTLSRIFSYSIEFKLTTISFVFDSSCLHWYLFSVTLCLGCFCAIWVNIPVLFTNAQVFYWIREYCNNPSIIAVSHAVVSDLWNLTIIWMCVLVTFFSCSRLKYLKHNIITTCVVFFGGSRLKN